MLRRIRNEKLLTLFVQALDAHSFLWIAKAQAVIQIIVVRTDNFSTRGTAASWKRVKQRDTVVHPQVSKYVRKVKHQCPRCKTAEPTNTKENNAVVVPNVRNT